MLLVLLLEVQKVLQIVIYFDIFTWISIHYCGEIKDKALKAFRGRRKRSYNRSVNIQVRRERTRIRPWSRDFKDGVAQEELYAQQV